MTVFSVSLYGQMTTSQRYINVLIRAYGKFDKNQLVGLKIATTEESRKGKPLEY